MIDALIGANVALTATPAILESGISTRPTADVRSLRALAPALAGRYETERAALENNDERSSIRMDVLNYSMRLHRKFLAAGGLLAAGVDPGRHNLPGFGDQRNYQLFVEFGFSPEQAIQIMTANGARVLGLESEIGSVQPGKRADLVVLDGDLTAEPAVISAVAHVIQAGVLVDHEKLISETHGQFGLR